MDCWRRCDQGLPHQRLLWRHGVAQRNVRIASSALASCANCSTESHRKPNDARAVVGSRQRLSSEPSSAPILTALATFGKIHRHAPTASICCVVEYPPTDCSRACGRHRCVTASRQKCSDERHRLQCAKLQCQHRLVGDCTCVRTFWVEGPLRPADRRNARIASEIMVQFAVDTSGRVDVGSFEITKISDDRLSNTIRTALPGFRDSPAPSARGRNVRQLVVAPFAIAVAR